MLNSILSKPCAYVLSPIVHLTISNSPRSPLLPNQSNRDFNALHHDALHLPIRLARINLLACLHDGFQDGLVVELRGCDDGRGLCVKGDLVGFDAFALRQLCSFHFYTDDRGGGRCVGF
jgi:hypothetical protein